MLSVTAGIARPRFPPYATDCTPWPDIGPLHQKRPSHGAKRPGTRALAASKYHQLLLIGSAVMLS